MDMKRSIYLGYDPRESRAFRIARTSLFRYMHPVLPVHWLCLEELKERGLYRRPYEWRQVSPDWSIMWDIISDAPQSTEHANSRWLVKELAGTGWVMFCDCDVLFRDNVNEIFNGLDPAKALYCVQHDYQPAETIKMDGQIQTKYARKNWSSVFVLNCEHPANAALTVEMINTLPGRELHAFCWLMDKDIGALDPGWNYLVGVSPPCPRVHLAHFTLGTPDMPGFYYSEFADEWRDELERCAA